MTVRSHQFPYSHHSSNRCEGLTGVDPERLVGTVHERSHGQHVGGVERARSPDGETGEGREGGLDEGELVVEAEFNTGVSTCTPDSRGQ